MFLGFHLAWETNWILQAKFPLVPHDNGMSPPDSLFVIRRDRDYVAMMYDVFHREESETATSRPLPNLNLIVRQRSQMAHQLQEEIDALASRPTTLGDHQQIGLTIPQSLLYRADKVIR